MQRNVEPVAASVTFVALPYEVKPKHGEDVTDYLVRDGHSTEELRVLLTRAADDLPWDAEPNDADTFEAKVAKAVEQEHIRVEARTRVAHEREAASLVLPDSRPTLADDLAAPLPPPSYTIDTLHPTGANSLLTSKFKAGKTTLLMNLLRALVDGVPFLDRFEVESPAGRVAFWNYELDERQFLGTWLHDLGIENPERAATWTLRGHRLPLLVPAAEDAAVQWLVDREVSFLIVDPFARAFSGSGEENSNTDVGRFLEALDVVKQRAGVEDLVLSTHTGRMSHAEGEERTRGATRLDDWTDVRWMLTQDKALTYFSASGRDVGVAEEALSYDPVTRRLAMGGPSRARRRVEEGFPKVLRAVQESPGIAKQELQKAIGGKNDRAAGLIREAVDRGFVRIERVGTKQEHYLTDAGSRLANDPIPVGEE